MATYPTTSGGTLTAEALRRRFDAVTPFTVGLEEELMLLDRETLDLLPRAADVIARAGGDPRFKLELPASQLEIVLPPVARVPDAVTALAEARRALAEAAEDVGVPAAAGAHPFAAAIGVLNAGERYDAIAREFGDVARCQLVCALQVHVAVGGAERSLAVYNALRSFLPEIAALAANAPFHAGRDTGLASVRPKVCDLLPRQGMPPAIESWEAYAEALRWGAAAGGLQDPRRWWWELRPHPLLGTLEMRVPDAQATVADAGAVAALVQALVAWLAERADAGDLPEPDATWRIEENRWAACRHGVQAELADLVTGERVPARELLAARIDALAATAAALGCERELHDAHRLATDGGAQRQRAAAADGGGAHAAARWLVDSYAPSPAAVR